MWDSLLPALKGKGCRLDFCEIQTWVNSQLRHTQTWTDDDPPTCVLLLPAGPRQVAYSTTSVFPGPAALLDQTSAFRAHLCLHAATLPTASPPARLGSPAGTHRHHVITLHVGLVVVFTFVVELAEEVEGHHGIEINHHGQETDGQDQLGAERETEEAVGLPLKGWWETPRKQESGTMRGRERRR